GCLVFVGAVWRCGNGKMTFAPHPSNHIPTPQRGFRKSDSCYLLRPTAPVVLPAPNKLLIAPHFLQNALTAVCGDSPLSRQPDRAFPGLLSPMHPIFPEQYARYFGLDNAFVCRHNFLATPLL